jgi:hypothetical protein
MSFGEKNDGSGLPSISQGRVRQITTVPGSSGEAKEEGCVSAVIAQQSPLSNDQGARHLSHFNPYSPHGRALRCLDDHAGLLNSVIANALRHTSGLGPGFKCDSYFFGTHESSTDVSIFRSGIERN